VVPVTARESLRLVLVVATFALVQDTLVLDLRIGTIHPDVMVLLPIMAGLVGGPATGASMGFGAGLVADLFLPTPFGLSALVGTVVGFAVGAATVALDRTSWWLPPAMALLGSAVYELSYASIGSLLGQPQMLHVDLLRVVVLVSVVNGILSLPARRLVSWSLPSASTEGIPTSAAVATSR
jgi:rod shape-determining protein MreD